MKNRDKVGIIASTENSFSYCEEDFYLDGGFENLEQIINDTKGLFYIWFIHHSENRLWGGNISKEGLKSHRKVLFDDLNDKKIAIDSANTIDQVAYDILNYIDQKNIKFQCWRVMLIFDRILKWQKSTWWIVLRKYFQKRFKRYKFYQRLYGHRKCR